jgi:hypothetical protein
MSTRVVSERLIVQIDFAAWMGGSFLKISPNSQRVAYAARVGTKQFVVVDGNEEKPYDAIMPDTLRFSPDSQRVAYAARVGTKRFVVVDGRRDKQYDAIVTIGGVRISFDLANNLRYLARKGAAIYVVEERIKGAEECTYAGAFS